MDSFAEKMKPLLKNSMAKTTYCHIIALHYNISAIKEILLL
jgi:hypothetical protein